MRTPPLSRVALVLAAVLGAGTAQAGLFDDEEARRQIADLKIKSEARFDQQANGQLELASQLSRQAEEIARLRGQIETLNFELETTRKRQQDFYLDLDSRLRKLEPQAPVAGADEGTAGTAEGNPAAANPALESQAYETALGQFKAGKYKEAAASFAGFVQQYPTSSLAPNAQYWLGNSWYAQRNCAKAIEAHSVVTSKYAASDKAPDAWISMATCQQEMGNAAAARRSLETVLGKYPDSPAADTARQRLKKK
jgi:tol-pal system protein YbgF